MGKTLIGIAQQLKDKNKKVQLIYAFNGTGKTRLSREFRNLIDAKTEEENAGSADNRKILYYNAFTEDLFYWDNDLKDNLEPKLKIHENSFTSWIFKEQGQDRNVIENFQYYTNDKLNPYFNSTFTEVKFSFERGNDEDTNYIKISKGEESCFVWSVFYSLLKQVIEILNTPDPVDRGTPQFNNLEYIFIDDPVSSLDENHLIELAVNLAKVIKSSYSELKFIITTHNSIFYNVFYNELKEKTCYLLERLEDETFKLEERKGDSNKSFSYHLHLKRTLESAIESNQIQKYHFTLLRNLYEKTSSFLGFPKWSDLLPDDKETYYNRVIQFTTHSTVAGESVADPSPQEKETIKLLLRHLIENYSYWEEEKDE